MQEQAADQWHIRPSVMVAVIGWLLTISLGGISWAVTVSRDLAVLQAQIQTAKDDNKRQDETASESLRLIREELRDMKAEMRQVREALQRSGGK